MNPIEQPYCNNCGKHGHLYNQCKLPITSNGLISFRINTDNNIEFLLIRRRHTLGFIDFMRGKYTIHDKEYIINMFKQMTKQEKYNIQNMSFGELWQEIWGVEPLSTQYKNEEIISKDKLKTLKSGVNVNGNVYDINNIIELSNLYELWEEAEWGFPKGRRNFKERDYECGIREFCEETGYNESDLNVIQNMNPYEEIFTGSNYKSYKHKYYLTYIPYNKTKDITSFEKSEVSKMDWFTYEECLKLIRTYNIEKKNLLTNIYHLLNKYKIINY